MIKMNGNQRRAGGSRWVPLNLNQIQRQEKSVPPSAA